MVEQSKQQPKKDQKPKVKIVDPNAKPAHKEPIAPWKQN